MSQDIYAIFAAIVAGMDSRPAFSFGYWPEVSEDLILKGKVKTNDGQKYPLIVMHSDFEEKRGNDLRFLCEINPKFYLIEESKQTYSTPDRIRLVYNTVLYPLYEEFIQALQDSTVILNNKKENLGEFTHTKKDLFYIGSLNKNQNQLADILDAIELTFPSLFIRKQKCT